MTLLLLSALLATAAGVFVIGPILARRTALLADAAPGALLVIPTVPCFDERVDWLGGPSSDRNDRDRLRAVNAVIDDYREVNPVRLAGMPMDEWFCPGGEARPTIDGVELRHDGIHVGTPEAQAIVWGRFLVPALQALVPTP